ncbi:DUF885 family protein [Aquincola sp. J276]|uniref:DUF885 domain-containing protein n=1 Tax=Aquincola sp. J276 TaxID=2898432 RepID=UPI002151E313|nr:DUF885 domain-containing protein [Aquincola sp. J276]MCR5867887.1 DUF885 domain-containing protein [Aquincola sp. J276]
MTANRPLPLPPPRPARHRRLQAGLCSAAALWLAGCASAPRPAADITAPPPPATVDAASLQPAAPPSPAEAAAQAAEAGRRLRLLMDASDEAALARAPVLALYRGDTRRAAQHGLFGSATEVAIEREAAQTDLALLATVPRERLTADDRAIHDTFEWARQDALAAHSMPAAGFWPLLMLDHFNGWHLAFAELSSGQGVAPYRTVEDYENGLARLDGFVAWLDMAADRMREGQRNGIVLPRLVAQRVVTQFELLAGQGAIDSPFYGPIRSLPAAFSAADRERLTRQYTEAIEDRLRPALQRTQAFLAGSYLASARDSVGLWALPGGADYYAQLIRSRTTTGLDARTVHQLGLSEVERIRGRMQAVMQEVGYGGTLAQFLEWLRTDARFAPASAEALAQGYAGIGRRVDAALPRLFDAMPRTPLALRPTPDWQAATAAGGHYVPGSLSTGTPGVFFFNTHELPSRRTWEMETLYLHEANPGHHFQGSLAAEDERLPKLLRYEGNTAYAEGWALYAESLGPALGLFTDPYQRFGHYDAEMLRALRLVVDTGLHAFGWSREQAIDYMLAHSAMSRIDATAEVERYIVNPGQALAYKVGALTIAQLRERAQQALGPRFDLKAFHRQVLGTGALPMLVLTAKIDAWIAAQQGR